MRVLTPDDRNGASASVRRPGSDRRATSSSRRITTSGPGCALRILCGAPRQGTSVAARTAHAPARLPMPALGLQGSRRAVIRCGPTRPSPCCLAPRACGPEMPVAAGPRREAVCRCPRGLVRPEDERRAADALARAPQGATAGRETSARCALDLRRPARAAARRWTSLPWPWSDPQKMPPLTAHPLARRGTDRSSRRALTATLMGPAPQQRRRPRQRTAGEPRPPCHGCRGLTHQTSGDRTRRLSKVLVVTLADQTQHHAQAVENREGAGRRGYAACAYFRVRADHGPEHVCV